MLIWFVVGMIVLSIIIFKYYGKNRESDFFKLTKKLAHQGNPRDQINLAMMYYQGNGVHKDFTKAIEWAEKAAMQGSSDALFAMGIMYTNKNDLKAFESYLQSAIQGNINAKEMTGLMYKEGRGVKQDYTKAFEWIQKAAMQDHVIAQNQLGVMY